MQKSDNELLFCDICKRILGMLANLFQFCFNFDLIMWSFLFNET